MPVRRRVTSVEGEAERLRETLSSDGGDGRRRLLEGPRPRPRLTARAVIKDEGTGWIPRGLVWGSGITRGRRCRGSSRDGRKTATLPCFSGRSSCHHEWSHLDFYRHMPSLHHVPLISEDGRRTGSLFWFETLTGLQKLSSPLHTNIIIGLPL